MNPIVRRHQESCYSTVFKQTSLAVDPLYFSMDLKLPKPYALKTLKDLRHLLEIVRHFVGTFRMKST